VIIIAAIIRLALCVILLRTAWHKYRAYAQFRTELAAYRLLPETIVPITAIALMVTETLCATLLLQFSSLAGLLLCTLLLLVYGAAMTINLLKGRSNIDCGCSGPLAARKSISWSLVLRNVALASLAALAIPASNGVAIRLADIPLILAGTACSLFLYEAVEQALANSQRYRHWLAKQPVRA